MTQTQENLAKLQAAERAFAERLSHAVWCGDDISAKKWHDRQRKARAKIEQMKKGEYHENHTNI